MNDKKNIQVGLLSGLFWGLGTVVLGFVLSQMSQFNYQGSLSVTWLHDSTSFIILLVLLTLTGKFRHFIATLKTKSGLIIMGAALLGGPLGMGAYILAIESLSPALAASISALYPAFGALLAYLILKEKISRKQIIGLIISVSAIMLMGISGQVALKKPVLGFIAVALCVVGWGSEAVIISWALKDEVDSSIALTIRQMTSSLVYGLFIIPLLGYESFRFIVIQPKLVMTLIIAASLGTFSYLFYYKAIGILGATKAMALNITYPFWAFLFQTILFRTFDLKQAILVLIILLGTFYGIDLKKDSSY